MIPFRQSLPFVFHVLLIAVTTSTAIAQSGWQSIMNNDDREARSRFLAALAVDSTDSDALKGMIYLSEIEGDPRAYSRYINTLLRNHWDEPLLLLFDDNYDGPYDSVLAVDRLSERAKIVARVHVARTLRSDRRFRESTDLYAQQFGAFRWSLIGPFRNLAGSGHVTPFPVESERFDPTATYVDETGLKLSWIAPEYCGTNGLLDFTSHLLERSGDTYFANTFFELPAAGRVQVRIGRSAPIKLWVDDCLVYEDADPVSFGYDGDIVELDLAAGTHRLLVKDSPMPNSLAHGDEYDQFEFFDAPYFNQELLSVRITDTTGRPIPGVTSTRSGDYTARRYTARIDNRFIVRYFEKRTAAEPDDLFNYYALCKAYMMNGQAQQSEELFVKTLRSHPDNTCIKYLTAKSFAQNGKIEAAYETLNGVDIERTPILSLYFDRLNEIDPDNDDVRYIEMLRKMAGIAPSNYRVLSRLIRYYKSKGMDEQRDSLIDASIVAYPDYAEYLEPQKSEHDVERRNVGDSVRKARVDSLVDRLKSHYDTDDYETVIEYYRDQNDHDAVVRFYDGAIGGFPQSVEYRLSKSRELFKSKRFSDALQVMDTVLSIAPYNEDALELVGDIYDQMKEKGKSLEYYRRAQDFSDGGYGYSSSIDRKIEKIEGPRAYKSLFSTKSFSDIVNAENWKEKFAGEDAVILMYTRDMILDTNKEVRHYHRMMVKILTEAGANAWTQMNFEFMGSIDFVKVVKENGAEIIPDQSGEYVVFKNLAVGDLIQIEGQAHFHTSSTFPGEYYTNMGLWFDSPIYYSKFEILVPHGRYLGYLHHRLDSTPVRSIKGEYDSYKWEYSELPKTDFESALIDRLDPYRYIFISTMPDWSKVVDWYGRMTYRKLEPTYDIEAQVARVIDEGMTERQKMIAIYNYITKEINYSSVPFLQSAYIPKKANLTLSARIGDCKDVATLMIDMLRVAGIEAQYVLVKTASYNRQQYLPSIYFNHAIVACSIEGSIHYLDLVTDFYPYYVLPESDAGAWALLIKDGEKQLFQLPYDDLDADKSTAEISVDAELNLDRSLDMKVAATHHGVGGGRIRESLYGKSREEAKNFILATMGRDVFSDLHLENWDYANQIEITEPLRSSYTFTSARFSDKVSNLLIFRLPYMVGVPTSKALLNKNRRNDLDLRDILPVEPVVQKLTLRFPKGYTLTEFPKDIHLESRFGRYTVHFKKQKDGLLVEKRQQFFVSEIPVADFQEFKDFYLQVLDVDAAKYAIIKGRR